MTDTVRAKCPDCGGRSCGCARCGGSGQVDFKMPAEIYATFCPACRSSIGGGDASFLTTERAERILARTCCFCGHEGLQFVEGDSQ